ncbi:MAG: hypothetical protein JHD16_00505 [Solirubrobacteraceae bacterium]|nr:hypothetical protein [Solirubrobacteraceae bacterium]
MNRSRLTFLTAAAALVTLIPVPAAQAAPYRAEVCAPGQAGEPTHWTLETNFAALHELNSDCASGSGVSLTFDGFVLGSWNGFHYGRAVLNLPGTSRLTAVDITRDARVATKPHENGHLSGSVQAGLYIRTGFSSYQSLDTVTAAPGSVAEASGDRSIALGSPTSGALVIRGECHIADEACVEPSHAYAISQMGLTLDDSTPPDASAEGPLTLDPWLAGTKTVSVSAMDTGIGLGTARVLVDGQVIDTIRLGTCAPESRAGTYRQMRPCTGTGEGVLTVDTTKLADGPRSVAVDVSDELGNRRTILERDVDVRNQTNSDPSAPAPTGVPQISGAAIVGQHLTATIPVFTPATPTSTQWLRCDPAGRACRPIAGATNSTRLVDRADTWSTLRVRVTADRPSGAAATSEPTAPVTDAPGTVQADAPLAAGVSAGGVALVTQTIIRQVDPTAAEKLTLRLLAPSRRHVRVGARVVIGGQTRTSAGRLRAGIRVRVQRHDGKRWRTIRTLRTRSNGTYRTTLAVRGAMRLRAVSSSLALEVTRSRGLTIRPRNLR